MSKQPVWTAVEAERELLRAGFVLLRSKGSHRIYFRDGRRVVIPFHKGRTLHPKIVRQVLDAIGDERESP